MTIELNCFISTTFYYLISLKPVCIFYCRINIILKSVSWTPNKSQQTFSIDRFTPFRRLPTCQLQVPVVIKATCMFEPITGSVLVKVLKLNAHCAPLLTIQSIGNAACDTVIITGTIDILHHIRRTETQGSIEDSE